MFVSAQNLYRTNVAYLYVGSEISHKDFGWLASDHSLLDRGGVPESSRIARRRRCVVAPLMNYMPHHFKSLTPKGVGANLNTYIIKSHNYVYTIRVSRASCFLYCPLSR